MTFTPQRILFVDHIAVLGGGELALLALVRELDRTRFTPVVLLFSEGPLVAEMQGIAETHLLPLPRSLADARRDDMGSGLPLAKAFQLLGFLFALRSKMDDLRPALVHTNSLKADILGGIAARSLRLPLIWHMRDRIAEEYLPAIAVRALRAACRWIPSALIANSQSTMITLKLPSDKPAKVINSGMNLAPFLECARGTETLPEAIAQHHEVRIGLIGRICEWKGQDVFLRAAAIVHASHPQTRFVLIGAPLFGEEEYELSLKQLAIELGLGDSASFTGFQRDIPRCIGDLHIVVHASTVPEPFGQVIVQGMAAGKPVIATEGGGPSEIIHEGHTGFLTPRGDPEALAARIQFLLTYPEIANSVALRGQQVAHLRYGVATTTRAVEHLYSTLLEDIA
jgi:glycosyltransferase involved in cell wall biosynthesis